MPECCTQIIANTTYRPCAVTARQVNIKKLPNHLLADAMNVYAALGQPVGKVRNARNVSGYSARCVAALGEVMRKSINIR